MKISGNYYNAESGYSQNALRLLTGKPVYMWWIN